MLVPPRDEYPTAQFQELDEAVASLHTAYLQFPSTRPAEPDYSTVSMDPEAKSDAGMGEPAGAPSDATGAPTNGSASAPNAPNEGNESPNHESPKAATGDLKTPTGEPGVDPSADATADDPQAVQRALRAELDELQRKELELKSQVAQAKAAVELLRQPIQLKQRILLGGALLLGMWLSYGIGTIVTKALHAPWFLWILVGLLPAAGLLALVMRTAETIQYVVEANKEPKAIPYLAHLADCYVRLIFKSSPDSDLSEEQDRILERRLSKWKQERQHGISIEEAKQQKGLLYILLGTFTGFLFLSSMYAYGFLPPQKIVEGFMIFGIPAVMLAAIVFWLAPLSLRLPEIGELHEDLTKIASELQLARLAYDQRTQAITEEERRKDEERQRQLQLEREKLTLEHERESRAASAKNAMERDAVKRSQLERQSKLDAVRAEMRLRYEQELKAWEKAGKKLLEDLRTGVAEWEAHRGFTTYERGMIQRQLHKAHTTEQILGITSFLSIMALTYFASITLNEIMSGSYLYPGGNVGLRVALLPWVIWVVVIWAAEKWALVPNLVKLRAIAYKEKVLQHGYERSDRVKAYRYSFVTPEEAALARKTPMLGIAAGIVVLAIELICNAIYLFKYSDVEGVLGYVVAFLPMAFFIVLMFPLAEAKENAQRLDEALLTPERPSQAGLIPAPTTAREQSAVVDLAVKNWESLGHRDPDVRR